MSRNLSVQLLALFLAVAALLRHPHSSRKNRTFSSFSPTTSATATSGCTVAGSCAAPRHRALINSLPKASGLPSSSLSRDARPPEPP